MECPATLLCDRCGLEAQVVMNRGFDRRGMPVLRPALVETEEGLFVFIDCMVHGRIAQCIACHADAHTAKRELRDIPDPDELSSTSSSGQKTIAQPGAGRSSMQDCSVVESRNQRDATVPRKPK
jgi:hypothetical protein